MAGRGARVQRAGLGLIQAPEIGVREHLARGG